MKKILLSTVAMIGLFSSAQAFAQQAEEPQVQDEEQSETIVVTGSRVERQGFENPTPTTVVDEEQIERSGLNDIGDVLQQQPQISVGLGSTNDTFQRDIGSTFINLRGLGTNRTLVLVNGRRRVSGSRDGSQVDVSSIPASMIKSVEVITGGASAVYGADAVSGVVNIILKDDFDGLNVSGRTGISGEGDAATYMLSVAGGGAFADDRGHARLGMSYQKSERVGYPDRDYSYGSGALSFVTNPANTGPDDGIPDRIVINSPHTIGYSYQPTFVVGGQRYIYDNGLVTYTNPNCYGSVCSGGDYGYDSRERALRNPRETFSAMGGVDYEIAPSVTAYADFEFSYASTKTNGQSFFDASITLQRDNPFLPSEVTALMDANGMSSIKIGYEGEAIFGNKQYSNSRYTYTASGGVRGELGRFKWDAFYQYGRRDQTFRTGNTRIESNFYQAVDAVLDPVSGDPVCRSTSAQAAGCTPIDLFSGALSDADKAYFGYTFQRSVTNEQILAGAQLTGPIFDLPAGAVQVAVGGEYRKDKLQTLDDGLGAKGLLYRTDNGGPPVDASTDVAEAFAEIVVPVLRNSFLADSLDLEGAVRYSHYDTIGSTVAWKLGADYAPIDGIRFRVTRSRSVRAPSIVELYSPDTLGTLNITADPCDVSVINLTPNREANCRALGVPVGWVDPAAALALSTALGGNPDLTEETSNSWTAGVVVRPFRGLNISVDYWSIKIDDAIQTLDGNSIVDKCVDSDSLDNAFCPLVTRGNFVGLSDPYVISKIDLRQINIGKLTAEGVDFAISYRSHLEDLGIGLPGSLGISANVTYLAKLEELVDREDPGSLLISDGEYGDPTWRGNLNINYTSGSFSANWQVRYVGSAQIDVQQSSEYNGGVRVDERFYNDVFLSYGMPQDVKLSLGVNNLFDEHPPRTPYTYSGTFDGSLYDNIGRYFFVAFSKDF
ncbi:MAG: hypothetical protein CMN73_09990 [Sphingomonas sp.]|nr:hypothetical protein [Sphingomonas sp.]